MVALVLAACNSLARDPQVDAEVRRLFDQLRHHKDVELVARLDPSLRDGAVRQLPTIESYVPAGEPRGRKLIGTNTFRMGEMATLSLPLTNTTTATERYW